MSRITCLCTSRRMLLGKVLLPAPPDAPFCPDPGRGRGEPGRSRAWGRRDNLRSGRWLHLHLKSGAMSQAVRLEELVLWNGADAASLTSMKHGPFAELSPVASCSEKSVVRYHGSIVTSPAWTTLRAPALIHLYDRASANSSAKVLQLWLHHVHFCTP